MIREVHPVSGFFFHLGSRYKKITRSPTLDAGTNFTTLLPLFLVFYCGRTTEIIIIIITKRYGNVPYIRTRNYSMNLESIYVWGTPGRTLSIPLCVNSRCL
jgi:hypothetical protein